MDAQNRRVRGGGEKATLHTGGGGWEKTSIISSSTLFRKPPTLETNKNGGRGERGAGKKRKRALYRGGKGREGGREREREREGERENKIRIK